MSRSNGMLSTITSIFFKPTSSFYTFLSPETFLKVCIYLFIKIEFCFSKTLLCAFVTLSPFSLASISVHRKMQSVEDSAQRSQPDRDDIVLGTADESKAPNAKGPTVDPSTSKRKRAEQNDDEQVETTPKKNRGGRQALTNTAEYISHDRYNTVPGESKHERDT